MKKIRRETKIFLKPVAPNTFDIFDRDDNLLMSGDNNYFIYFKNVNFRSDGSIDARYLGEATDTLIDGYAREATYGDGEWSIENVPSPKRVRTARMVVVDNKSKVIVVIQND